MRLDNTSQVLNTQLTGEKNIVVIAEKTQWLRAIVDGQILKGRILRHYGDNRYGINFSGKERIVDSAIPLTVGELLSGKVIGISHSAVSVQIISQGKEANKENNVEVKRADSAKQAADLDIFAGMKQQILNLKLSDTQINHIIDLANNAAKPQLIAQLSLFLIKLGLPVSKVLVDSLEKRMAALGNKLNSDSIEGVLSLSLETAELPTNMDSVDQPQVVNILAQHFLAQHIKRREAELEMEWPRLLSDELEPSKKATTEGSDKPAMDLSWDGLFEDSQLMSKFYSHVFNIQTGAAYQHRFETLPIMIDGRLMEFDIVFFDHSLSENQADVKSRHLNFVLATEYGEIFLSASIINNRVSLKISADNHLVIGAFKDYHDALQAVFKSAGWVLDTAEYKVESDVKTPAVSLLNHVLEQESLQVFI